MPKKQLTEDEADKVNDTVSAAQYALDAKSGANMAKKAYDINMAARRLRNFQSAGRVVLGAAAPTKVAAKRAPVVGAIVDTALLLHPDTRASVFREVEDDAKNAGAAKRMVKGALGSIPTAAGIANMVSETNEMMDKELLEAAEPDSRYLAKKRKELADEKFQDAVERRIGTLAKR